MKGLIIKDICTLLKQMKFFLAFIVLFTIIPNFSVATFAIVYSTMLPLTTIAYDERSKWDKLAAMMPYSAMDMVFSKYVLGYILVIATALISCFAQAIAGIFTHTALTSDYFASMVIIVAFAIIVESIELPFLVRFGAEKGRMLIIILVVGLGVGGVSFIQNVVDLEYENLNMMMLFPIALIAAAVISALSVLISVKLFKGKPE